jgi:hypothetical protein
VDAGVSMSGMVDVISKDLTLAPSCHANELGISILDDIAVLRGAKDSTLPFAHKSEHSKQHSLTTYGRRPTCHL